MVDCSNKFIDHIVRLCVCVLLYIHSYLIITFDIHVRIHYTLYTHKHTERERECVLFVSPGQRLILLFLSFFSPPHGIG